MTTPEPPPHEAVDFLAPPPTGVDSATYDVELCRAARVHLRSRVGTLTVPSHDAGHDIGAIDRFLYVLKKADVTPQDVESCGGPVTEQDLAAALLRTHMARATIEMAARGLIIEARARGWSWKLIARLLRLEEPSTIGLWLAAETAREQETEAGA